MPQEDNIINRLICASFQQTEKSLKNVGYQHGTDGFSTAKVQIASVILSRALEAFSSDDIRVILDVKY